MQSRYIEYDQHSTNGSTVKKFIIPKEHNQSEIHEIEANLSMLSDGVEPFDLMNKLDESLRIGRPNSSVILS